MKTKMSIPQRIVAYVKGNPIVVMMALVSIVVGFTIPNFFSLNNFNVLMGNTTIRFLIALGVSGCLITKGTDLSAGRQAALAATLTGVMVQRIDYSGRLFTWLPEMNMWVVLIIVLFIGALLGLLSGCNTQSGGKYEIRTVTDLLNMAKDPKGTYTLLNDLDMADVDWTPIADFSGTFDGKGNTKSHDTCEN